MPPSSSPPLHPRVAIIPARGGSKRLPRKNILPLGGRPVLAHVVGTALASGVFDRVLVSTEDSEIADVAAAAGAEVHQRPAALADDLTGVVEVCLEVLDILARTGAEPAAFCCIYATAFGLRPADLQGGARCLAEGPPDRPDGVMCVSPYNFYPHVALHRTEDGLQPFFPDLLERPRTSLPEMVASNGTFYIARTAAFRAHRTFYLPRLAAFELPAERVVDLDTPADYARAQLLYPLLSRGATPA
ncbi:cytidylyltransferase domain-containing protein [Roseospirillum parvum]|uniref:N-acylneuraminate cytidylyltransferase n=1 Tax=Roseospirillum parvum TaxID=83401 RepID=A0A1G8A4R1_9PROT|nr:acylneuraminate cytidylyltransferase family protein [Roseospirillum parvum]SDH15390.1 N-acylneuraminate cytidylyltransferase [Roseospirillum parvum]